MSFVYAATEPVIQLYFMQRISTEVLTIANILSVSIAAVTNTTVGKMSFMCWYRSNFKLIVVVDVLCFSTISFTGIDCPTVRFIGFAIINAISTTLWCIIMNSAINRKIEGDELTCWRSYTDAWELYASLAGGVLLLIIGDIHVETAISMQCLANLLMGITDIQAFNRMEQRQKSITHD